MSVESEILSVLRNHGYRVRSDKTKLRAVGVPGCGQGFKLSVRIEAEAFI